MKPEYAIEGFGNRPGFRLACYGTCKQHLLEACPRGSTVTIQYLHLTEQRCIVQLLVPDLHPAPGFEGSVYDVSVKVGMLLGLDVGPLGGVEIGEYRGQNTLDDFVAHLAEMLWNDKQALTCVEL